MLTLKNYLTKLFLTKTIQREIFKPSYRFLNPRWINYEEFFEFAIGLTYELYEKYPYIQFKDEAQAKSYIFKAIKRRFFNLIKRRPNQVYLNEQILKEIEKRYNENPNDFDEIVDELELNEIEREILELRYCGYKIKEIAKILNCNERTVRRHINSIKKKLPNL